MKNKVIRFIRETHMLKPGDRVIVAVSGGADSIFFRFSINFAR